jgi:C1A family cysteine protease
MKKFLLYFTTLVFVLGCDSSFPIDFEDIQGERDAIDADGDPVIVNPIDDGTREFGSDNSYCYGISEPDEDIAKIDIDIRFPEAYDLSEFLPPVDTQGNQGSCVAWATGYYMKSFQENYQNFVDGLPDSDVVLSPSFVFNQIKVRPCDGSQVADALELLKMSGTPDLNLMPYDENDCSLQPTDQQRNLAEENRIGSYYYLDGEILLEQTKAFLLQNQPVVIAISIDRNYFGAKEDGIAVYRKFKKADGAHAMLVVGYDDAMNAVKVVNSWGKGWGNDGFVWIDYKAFEEANNPESDFKILCEAWVSYDFIPVAEASL